LAGPAGVLGTGGADDAQLTWYPVQHLADAFTDDMQRAPAAAAGCVVNIEPHILARQMIGQRLAMGRPFGVLLLDPRTVLFAREIAVEIFKPERKLFGIEALGTAAELRALQFLDARFQTLDLAMPDRSRDIANQ